MIIASEMRVAYDICNMKVVQTLEDKVDIGRLKKGEGSICLNRPLARRTISLTLGVDFVSKHICKVASTI